jgi:hypothetical protein
MKNSILILVILSLGVLQSYGQTSDSLKKSLDKMEATDKAYNIKKIDKDSLLSFGSLEKLLSTDYHIISFKLTVFEGKGSVREFPSYDGDLLSTEMRDEIKSLRSGSIVTFELIKGVDKNNVKQKIEPRLFRIK